MLVQCSSIRSRVKSSRPSVGRSLRESVIRSTFCQSICSWLSSSIDARRALLTQRQYRMTAFSFSFPLSLSLSVIHTTMTSCPQYISEALRTLSGVSIQPNATQRKQSTQQTQLSQRPKRSDKNGRCVSYDNRCSGSVSSSYRRPFI